MFYASLTSLLGIADLLYSFQSFSWSFANAAFWYLLIFFTNDWKNVCFSHSVSEFLRSSATSACLLNYRSVPLLFSFQLQVQVLFLALKWTERIAKSNRLHHLRFLRWHWTCSTGLEEVSENNWKPRLGAQKIEGKQEEIYGNWKTRKRNKDQTLYSVLCYYSVE